MSFTFETQKPRVNILHVEKWHVKLHLCEVACDFSLVYNLTCQMSHVKFNLAYVSQVES